MIIKWVRRIAIAEESSYTINVWNTCVVVTRIAFYKCLNTNEKNTILYIFRGRREGIYICVYSSYMFMNIYVFISDVLRLRPPYEYQGCHFLLQVVYLCHVSKIGVSV